MSQKPPKVAAKLGMLAGIMIIGGSAIGGIVIAASGSHAADPSTDTTVTSGDNAPSTGATSAGPNPSTPGLPSSAAAATPTSAVGPVVAPSPPGAPQTKPPVATPTPTPQTTTSTRPVPPTHTPTPSPTRTRHDD